MALREKGDLPGALEHLRKAAAEDRDNPGVHYELGQTLRQAGDLAGAAAAFERALEIDPELREGYYALGTTLKQRAAMSRKPPAAAPSAADDLYKRGQAAAAQGDLDAARELLAQRAEA